MCPKNAGNSKRRIKSVEWVSQKLLKHGSDSIKQSHKIFKRVVNDILCNRITV